MKLEATTMTTILVVDDHPLVRRGIVQVLGTECSGSLVCEASNESEALAAVQNKPCSIVLLDISLPGRGGLELLKEIRALRPRLPVLVVSSHPESQFATRMLRAGAAGYLTKESPPEVLVSAVRQVLSGHRYVSATMAERLVQDLGVDSTKAPHELLSDREYDVMLRIASGLPVGKVAAVLNLSVKTVSTYRTRILEKMGLENNADLTQYAIRNKLSE
jgi:two-component system invasion response regulator UvrY